MREAPVANGMGPENFLNLQKATTLKTKRKIYVNTFSGLNDMW